MISGKIDMHEPAGTDLEMDLESRIEKSLARLRDEGLAERIMDAARLAAATHMVQVAEDVWSDVEAENSAK